MLCVMHYPSTEQGKKELSQRVAQVHATAVIRHLVKHPCSTTQKKQVLKAVVAVHKKQKA